MSIFNSLLACRLMAGVLGASVITVAIPAGQALACACCDTYRVVNVEDWDTLNVRAGPGTRHKVVYTLAPGEGCITQTGQRSGKWVRIDTHNGKGWVNKNYIKFFTQ